MRYSPAKLPSADVVKTNAMVINDFYGCDFSSGATNIDPRRSPNCENMIRSSPGRVRKRLALPRRRYTMAVSMVGSLWMGQILSMRARNCMQAIR